MRPVFLLIHPVWLCSLLLPFPSVLLHGCLQSLGLIDLWRSIVWLAGIGHLQGTVRINVGKKVLLMHYSSLSERIDACAELPSLEEWCSDNCVSWYVNLNFVSPIQNGGDVFYCLSHSFVLSGHSLSVTRNVPASCYCVLLVDLNISQVGAGHSSSRKGR